jgi:hypothetical protein
MNDVPANLPALGLAAPQPAGADGWSRRRWLTLIALVFAAHVGLIFLFGEKNNIAVRPATNVPSLKLADDSDELPGLNDPSLFARPNPRDFSAVVWRKMPDVTQPSFRFTESPSWLPLPAENLGMTFSRFMQTNYFAGQPLDFKPQPKLSEPVLPVEPAFAQNSTLRIEGGLARRRLLNQINLPSLPDNDVILPSKVQALADAAGGVVSTVLLESSGFQNADDKALELARSLRFTPSPGLTFGELVFNWRTIPVTTTNDNSNAH